MKSGIGPFAADIKVVPELYAAQEATLKYMRHHRQYEIGVKDWRSVDGLFYISLLCPTGSQMVEVGSYWGESIMFFWKSGKFRLITAIDPGTPDIGGPQNNDIIRKGVIEPSSGVVQLLEMTGHEAATAGFFRPEELDLVYIDAVHDYENLSQDIRDWYPKVKPGGFIGGHDYDPDKFPGVVRAVQEAFPRVDRQWEQTEQAGPDMVFTDTSWIKRKPCP